jgi:hypothetical protein
MAIVIKNIRGRRYRYHQRSYREGGRVRTKSTYLGPVDGPPRRKGILGRIGEFITINLQHDFIVSDGMLQRGQKQRDAEEDQRSAKKTQKLAELYTKYGLRLGPRIPVPVEKPTPPSPILTAMGRTAAPSEVPPDTAAVATDAPDAKDGEADT